MPLWIISGSQTGADPAGWRAARWCGVPTGGWMPGGWLAENGPGPNRDLPHSWPPVPDDGRLDRDGFLRRRVIVGRYARVFNAVGNRKSSAPGIGARVEHLLMVVLTRVGN